MSSPVLFCQDVCKTFHEGKLQVEVLRGISLEVYAGEKLAILGSSGAGKSTLLHILGGLSEPSSGLVQVLGQNIFSLSQKKRGILRNKNLGFIYQFHHLLPEFSALENVAMPLLIRGEASARAFQEAGYFLDRVGLSHRLDHKPGELSGGERQRTAVARALVCQPACLLADEPTGNLDRTSAGRIFDLLLEISAEHDTSVVTVTHDRELAAQMDRQIEITDGLVEN